MDDTLINLRIGLYHFQWYKNLKIEISKNEYHKGYPYGFFEVYNFFGIFEKINDKK